MKRYSIYLKTGMRGNPGSGPDLKIDADKFDIQGTGGSDMRYVFQEVVSGGDSDAYRQAFLDLQKTVGSFISDIYNPTLRNELINKYNSKLKELETYVPKPNLKIKGVFFVSDIYGFTVDELSEIVEPQIQEVYH